MKKILIIAGILLVIALVVWKNLTKENENVIPVQMEKIRRITVEQVVSATGNIRPVTEVKISANISAEIWDILVQEGDEVKEGQVLVILDSLRYSASVAQARSALRATEASYTKIKAEYERGKELYKNRLISSQELETLEASYKLAEANVEQSRARLNQVQDDLRKTILVAPMSGIVTSIRKEPGEMALGSVFQADVLLTISDLSAMEVIINVDETDVVSIHLGNKAMIEVDALPDVTLTGKVSQIAKSAISAGLNIQDDIVNYEVRILIDMDSMDPRILPGMSVTANITTAVKENVVAIPIQSLTARPEKKEAEEEESADEKGGGDEGEDTKYSVYSREKEKLVDVVFIAVQGDKDGKGKFSSKKNVWTVEQRPVEIGISSANFYEVLSGVEEGEMIITGNYKAVSKLLKDGSRVKPKKTDKRSGKKWKK